ncbi:phosphodiester glycosidase family protein [Nostoc sp. FACHB-152]|uniref:phosphodiester glycosidase family protein n=1 Tax=unclassified Nostoc TaxID=2593658 RepID=UPI0016874F93|nr:MULTISPECIES: phosphodiester glycosidase family protein [unclassified Nostoc]MBD2447931.1 phosphodiester glycosidase family protein [Nostoc sp. FACHB-152]MBD2468495.1 phosphodiester glycosidase family protein [Nostoc sp. FACHB-145]
MVKMPNCCRKKSQSAVPQTVVRHLFPATLSPIIATILSLSSTWNAIAQTSPSVTPSPTPSVLKVPASVTQISLNGRTLSGAWLQRPRKNGQVTTLLSDGAFRQIFGVDFLNSNNPARQPVQWFSSTTKPIVLTTELQAGYRYLDITKFAQQAGWQLQANSKTLTIVTPQAQIKNIVASQQALDPSVTTTRENRIVVDLDRPTPWIYRQGLPIKPAQTSLPDDLDAIAPKATTPPNREWTITLDAIADPALIQRYTPAPPPPSLPNLLKQLLPEPAPPQPTPDTLIQKVEVVNNQTILRISVPFGYAPRITTLANPNRLIVEIRPDAMVERNIAWASGLRWRQQFISLGTERFSVVWLEANPRTVILKPIPTNPDTLAGTAPLIQTAQKYLAVAAINGGYFNRNNRLPLGAIRRDNQWLSGPILNRGAIAWNDSGQFYVGRLTLQETLIAPNNVRLPILFLNSGYVQSGIARYTPIWGQSYIPLTDNETILLVQKGEVSIYFAGGKAGETAFPIPQNGYLLTLRGTAATAAAQLPVGTKVTLTSATTPADFSRYPNIVGAGPLLIENGQIVLDAQAEKFSNAFIAEKAVRSGICTTATGTLMIAAVQNRAGGAGPTLAEHAQLMQKLGCVNALNLDGGSSTSLYLGGQLLDRSPNTAARVHNGIGIFIQQR